MSWYSNDGVDEVQYFWQFTRETMRCRTCAGRPDLASTRWCGDIKSNRTLDLNQTHCISCFCNSDLIFYFKSISPWRPLGSASADVCRRYLRVKSVTLCICYLYMTALFRSVTTYIQFLKPHHTLLKKTNTACAPHSVRVIRLISNSATTGDTHSCRIPTRENSSTYT